MIIQPKWNDLKFIITPYAPLCIQFHQLCDHLLTDFQN